MYEGNKLCDVTFYMRERDPLLYKEPNPFKWVIQRASDLFCGKRVVVFGLPGAFTPTCSNSQLPGYEAKYDVIKNAGIDEVYCTSVNDAFVMYQWAKSQNVEKVKMLPDGNGDFAQEMGMLVDKSNLGFGKRSWRYSAVIEDMKIERIFAEPGIMDMCPDDPYILSDEENLIDYLNLSK